MIGSKHRLFLSDSVRVSSVSLMGGVREELQLHSTQVAEGAQKNISQKTKPLTAETHSFHVQYDALLVDGFAMFDAKMCKVSEAHLEYQ